MSSGIATASRSSTTDESVRLSGPLRRFLRETSGGVMVYFGLILPILLAVSGLAVDVGLWYANKRVVQSAADAAALGGALEVKRMGNLSTLTQAATEYATENGYKSGQDTLTINSPPSNGPYTGVANVVEVILDRPVPSFLSSIIHPGQTTVTGRAVATAGTKDACIWALNPTEAGAITVTGGAQVNIACGIMANSSSASAITQNGGSCINATYITSVGGASGGCIYPDPTSTDKVKDPFVTVTAPPWSGCDYNSQIKANNNQTIDLWPGVYCNKITVQNGGTINFNPGLYVLNGAALTIHGTATGAGVQFYLTQNTGQNDNITVNAGSTVNLSAPGSGDETYGLPAGVLMYQDRNSTAGVTHTFNGQASMTLSGILYLPNANIQFAGGVAADPTSAAIVGDTVTFTGSSAFGDYDGSPVAANPQMVEVTLVE